MKNILSLILFIAINSLSIAQTIGVKSLNILENDLDARVNYPKRDQNNEICAIIKVVTTQTGFTFDVGSLGVVEAQQKNGEIWVYVPRGIQRITIAHSQLGVLRNYPLSIPIQSATVYELVLTTGIVKTIVAEPEIESQWLIITSLPEGANVFIDNKMVGITPFQRRYRVGKYAYRIELPKYHTQAGTISIEDDKGIVEAKLKPNFGSIKITSSPEDSMAVFINDNNTRRFTPTILERVISGDHTIEVMNKWYQPQAKKITVNDSDTTAVNFEMKPTFANITINANTDATIKIDDERVGESQWKGRLLEGIYKIGVEKERYYTQSRTIEVIASEDQSIDIELEPKVGSIDIVTLPIEATVAVNGEVQGTSPLTIKNLTIGSYNLSISKKGYSTVNKTITIEENKTCTVEEKLEDGIEISIDSDPSNSLVTIDGDPKGNTPLKIRLKYGSHQVDVLYSDISISKNIEISDSSQTSFLFSLQGEQLDWQTINNTDDISSLEKFKDKYPNSKYIEEAIERLLYLKATQQEEIGLFEDYFNKYRKGAFIDEISNYMKNYYISKGDKYFNQNYYSIALSHYKKYVDYFPKGSNISYAKKQIDKISELVKKDGPKNELSKRDIRLARRKDATFLVYNYDQDSRFGITLGGLNLDRRGWYMSFKSNNLWTGAFTWANEEYDSDNIYTGKTIDWNAYISVGTTAKLFYPIWIYGGLGMGFSTKLHQFKYFSFGDTYFSKDSNSSEYGWEIFPEVGLYMKLFHKLTLKYGIFYIANSHSKSNKIIHQFGIGIAFNKKK